MTTRTKLTLERTYQASIDDVWALWTTRDGIESWWGPEGFSVAVRSLDLRAGGQLLYVMTATAPEQVAFMKQHGMPVATEATISYTEVAPMRRLAYLHRADFIPGVAPYDISTCVSLSASGDRVHMLLEFDPMHDEVWTGRAVQGWESELRKLDAAIEQKRANGARD